ncbi:4Fe-4S dicluster domain-containing protein [Calderihabitans maritimus]|uniref:4Fe-4S dicluster domain-containing protein n=1 Tax=Calderihabitans maritimus TaxID=1246530 RepID=UPI0034D1FB28
MTIDEQYCKGCFLCLHYCPKKVIGKSKKINGKGYTLPYIANPDACTMCRTCELICPELAVTVEGGAS